MRQYAIIFKDKDRCIAVANSDWVEMYDGYFWFGVEDKSPEGRTFAGIHSVEDVSSIIMQLEFSEDEISEQLRGGDS